MNDERSVADALQAWRDADRRSVRSTTQREAADIAVEAAQLAAIAARATSDAASSAMTAATEAARAATATAEAADRVVAATRTDADAARILERDAIAGERQAQADHQAARDRADDHYRDGA